jgi:hypothetical protein
MGSRDDWGQLLQALRSRYAVSEPVEGRIAVTSRYRAHGPVEVELVMTPREWDDLVSIPYGQLEPAIAYVLAEVAATQPGMPYLVYHQYELVPSATAELPPDPEDERVRALVENAPPGSFAWVAYRPVEGGPQSGPPPPK